LAGLLEVPACALELAEAHRYEAEIVQRGGHAASLAKLTVERQALLADAAGLEQLRLIGGHDGEPAQRPRLTPAVAQRAIECQALLDGRARGREVALIEREPAEPDQCLGAVGRRRARGIECQTLLQRAAADGVLPERRPEAP